MRAHRSFRRIWKERDSAQPELLEKILDKDNLNRAYKRVKANKEAPGIDGMSVEEIGAYLRENQKELIERIKGGKYTPDPVRRVGTGCLRLSGFYGKDFWNRDTCTLTRRRYRCWVKPEGRTPQMLIKAMKKYPGLPDVTVGHTFADTLWMLLRTIRKAGKQRFRHRPSATSIRCLRLRKNWKSCLPRAGRNSV